MRARLVKARYSKSTMYLKFDCSLINLSVSFSVYVSCPPVLHVESSKTPTYISNENTFNKRN